MANYTAVGKIKTLLESITAIKYIGEAPDDTSKLGQKFPAVIIDAGSELFDIYAGNTKFAFADLRLILFVHITPNKTKMQNLLDLQTAINDKLLTDPTLTGSITNLRLIEIEKENYTNEAGQQIAKRTIKYQIHLRSDRC